MNASSDNAPRAAAGLIVLDPQGRVLVGRRKDALPFLGGFAAFVGGKIEASDPGHDARARAESAALRELEEEAGMRLEADRLIAVDHPELAAKASSGEHAPLVPAGRWVTPDFGARRFDTQFFLVLVREVLGTPAPRDRELDWVRFVEPRSLLDAWNRHEILLAPPTRHALESLAAGPEGRVERLVSGPTSNGVPVNAIESVAGIRQIPLLTPTLPPARHTNAYVIGHERLLIVEPATYEESEREKLWEEIARAEAAGGTVEAVFLTHHHSDHIGSASVVSARYDVPIIAHRRTAELLAGRVAVTRFVDEDDRIDLGADPGGGRFTLRVLFTPGHAPGHVVLFDERPRSRALIVGDMVSSLSTIVIDPPEGDMAEYLRQLARLEALDARILFPSHGMMISGGSKKFREYLDHRALREQAILGALLGRGVSTAEELVPLAYADTPARVHPIAARSCLAHLLKLAGEGRIQALPGERFEAPAPATLPD